MTLTKGAAVRVREIGAPNWALGTVVMASGNGGSVIVELEDGLHTGAGMITGILPLVVANGQVKELMTGVALEVEVATPVAHFELSPADFPVVIEALHSVTRVIVWSTTIKAPGKVEIPPLIWDLGHPVAVRYTTATGRSDTAEPPEPPAISGMVH